MIRTSPKTIRVRLAALLKRFFESEKAGGILLLLCTVVSLFLANSEWGAAYTGFWHTNIGGYDLEHWINHGLMTLFFLFIGLELEREIYTGELSSVSDVLLPLFAAVGGMVLPAFFYFLLNNGTPTQDGAGIPMATDIAFALGILTLLGKRATAPLVIFLTALAVIDDLGAILTIAIFYTSDISWINLGMVGVLFVVLGILNRLKVHNVIPYLIGGVAMWYFMHQSGVHATVTGIILAFVMPFGSGDEHSPSYILEHHLIKPVAFFILPVFALANTGIVLQSNWYESFTYTNSLGIMAGLLIGKPLGVFLFSMLAIKLRIVPFPKELTLRQILGVGFLSGIGFTMSIFITLLAFDNQEFVDSSKIAILGASFIAGLIGFLWLRFATPAVDEVEGDL